MCTGRNNLTLLFCIFALSVWLPLHAYCDDEQRGILKTGGITDFMLFYPGDSVYFKKLAILDEKIVIQIYRGFAVAKGEYKLRNTSRDSFRIKMGYPVNSTLAIQNNSVVSSIIFDQLYALKTYTNGRENMIARLPVDSLHPMDDNNWYVWTDTFQPGDTTVLSVYFIVNTNNAEVTQDNKHLANNAFLYLTATGTGKQPVQNGEIKIELMDNLKITDIKGMLPTSRFKVDDEQNVLLWQFNNLSPSPDDNVTLVYTPDISSFDFSYVSQRRLALFGSVDALFLQTDSNLQLAAHTFDSPFKVQKVNWKSLLTFAFLALGSILGLILLVWLFRRSIRYLKQETPTKGPRV